jgi:hypothetical protein
MAEPTDSKGEHMEFTEFPKLPRLSREIVITEKIDGTNASVYIGEDGTFLCGSRTRWITPDDDNFGFARWAHAHREDLMQLGAGHHFGEWWGRGIQRGYGLGEKRFSLFNTGRWFDADGASEDLSGRTLAPSCCRVVPVLTRGPFMTDAIDATMRLLSERGSYAAPGFMKPEGVVIFHTAARVSFKKTLVKDEMPKTQAERLALQAA